jgi:cytochrome c
MNGLEVNKVVAAVLVGGIAFMGATFLSQLVVRPQKLAQPAIKIESSGGVAVATASAPAAGAAKVEAALPPIAPLLAKADPAAGEALAKKQCVACHTFTDGGKAGVGPNLYGVVMGPRAHQEGFGYSAAMKAKGGEWDYEALNAWLRKPSAVVPGTRMAFAGLANEKQRADVIAYLRGLSHNPAPLPEP